MKVKRAIKILTEQYKEDDDLVMAWWDNESFPEVPAEDWESVSERLEHKMDWSGSHDDMQYMIELDSE